METKMTLKLEKSLLEKAKAMAKDRNMSLSEMIEDYLLTLNGNSPRVTESLQKEYDQIVGEPEFTAIKAFKFVYPDYSVRKYK